MVGTTEWGSQRTAKSQCEGFRVDRGPIDADFVRDRMESALSRRRIPDGTTAWRWVHGENDDLPGLRVDVWGTHATVALDDPSLEFLLEPVVDFILAEPGIDTIWENTRPVHDDRRDSPAAGRCLAGDSGNEHVLVREDGLISEVCPRMGLDAGLYPDMRDIRGWLRPYWPASVSSTPSPTPGPSPSPQQRTARHVDTVDLASSAIARAERNFEPQRPRHRQSWLLGGGYVQGVG